MTTQANCVERTRSNVLDLDVEGPTGTEARKAVRQLSFLHLLQGAAATHTPVDAGEIVVSNRDARRVLDLSRRKLRRLVVIGVLSSPGAGLVAVPSRSAIVSKFRDWARRYQPEQTRSAILAFVDAREICGAPQAEIPPDLILEACGTVLRQAGGTHRCDELSALLRVSQKAAKVAVERIAMLSNITAASPDRPAAPMTMEMVITAVPALAGAKNTCLDPEPRDFFEEPGLRCRARLAEAGSLLPPLALFAIVAAASMRREERLDHHMLMVQRFARFMARVVPEQHFASPDAIAQTLEYVAFSSEVDGELTPGVRDMVCRSWLMLTDVNTRYARAADSNVSRGLAALVPARHPGEDDFRRRLREHFKPCREAAREKRKAKADPLADSLPDKSDRFWNRMVELGIICDAARTAAAELGDSRRPSKIPYVEFLVTIPMLDDGGRRLCGGPNGHLQEERWRAWLEPDFRVSLGLGPLPVSQAHLPLLDERSDASSSANFRPSVIFERMGARAVAGGRTVKPFVATLADCGALAGPAGLDARVQRRRQTLLRTYKLPAPLTFPDGLMWFDARQEKLWRYALSRRRSIVPLDEFETAMLFAELGLNAVLESLCRANAFMQMEQSVEAWPTDESMPTHAGLCFAAIDKTPGNRDPEFSHFPVLDQTLLDAMTLAARVASSAGREDGLVPKVLIEQRLRWKRPNPRPYIFQWNNRALTLTEVAGMLRILLGNIADVSFHDFRHACATELFDLTNAPEIVKRALGHTSGLWRYYARRTAYMERREQKRRMHERASALADKGATRMAA